MTDEPSLRAQNGHPIERARLLLEQARYEQAADALRQAIAAGPDNPEPHALLAVCLSEQKRPADALAEAQIAVRLGPDWPYCHHVLGVVHAQSGNLRAAEQAVAEALRLDPDDAAHWALRGEIKLQQHHWPDALEAAEAGLRVDAQHVGAGNIRAMALTKLGRRREAGMAMDAALSWEPDNALTHANQGWSLLERGDHRRALEHFREALRLDPELAWARAGIVEALKARHLLYRWMLGYFFWMSRLAGRTRWAILLGGYAASRVLRGVADFQPALAPFVAPVLLLYLVFVFLSWTADPLFNLLLRLDRFGRLALSRQEIVASNVVGLCLAGALAGLAAWLVTRSDAALFAAIVSGVLMIPVSGTFACRARRGRLILAGYTIGLVMLGALSVAVAVMVGVDAAWGPLGLFGIGCFLFSWIAPLVSGWR